MAKRVSPFLGVTPGILPGTDIKKDKDMSGNNAKDGVFEKCWQGLMRYMQNFGIPS